MRVNGLKRALEQFSRRRRAKALKPVIASKSDEVETAALLITNEPFRHAMILHSQVSKARPGPPVRRSQSDHLQNQQIPVHEPLVAQRCSGIGMVVLIQRSVCRKVRCQQKQSLASQRIGFLVVSIAQ